MAPTFLLGSYTTQYLKFTEFCEEHGWFTYEMAGILFISD